MSANTFQTAVTDLVFGDIPFLARTPLFYFGLSQTNCDPTADEVDRSKTPILLIHGLNANESQWKTARKELAKFDVGSIFSLNLDGLITNNPNCGIDDYAQKVSMKIADIVSITGRHDVILIGHSMGGLIASFYSAFLALGEGIEVSMVITISSPWTTPPILQAVPKFISSYFKHLRHMLNEENFLDNLKSVILRPDEQDRFYCYYSTSDARVPGKCGRLDLAESHVHVVENKGHVTILDATETWGRIAGWINAQ